MKKLRRPDFPPNLIRSFAFILLAGLLTSTVCLEAQITIRVPADQPTIQAGINAANNGDTVLVSPGTYTEAISFHGKAITVTSGATSYSDPLTKTTVLRQPQFGKPVVVYSGSETLSTVLNGFTIIGLSQDPGTGSGSGTFYGPIIYGQLAHPTITNSDISSGISGVFVQGGLISGNHFTGFISSALQAGPATVIDNVFENTSSGQAALSADDSTLVERNIFRNTESEPAQLADGVVFINNLLYGSQGPLLYTTTLESSVRTVIAENTFNSVPPQNGKTLCSNGSACPGSQILVTVNGSYAGSTLLVANNIFYSNDATPMIGCQPYSSTVSPKTDTILFDHNIFSSTAGGAMLSDFCSAQTTPSGNFSADPQLASPSTGDFHLRPGSPAIDAGNNSIFAQVTTLGFSLDSDYDRNPRPIDATGRGYPIVDIGAYEYVSAPGGQATSVLLTPSTYDLRLDQSLTLSASVTSPLGTPFGTVSFFDNGVAAGTSTLSSLGVATLTLSNLSVGLHQFEADYPGQAPFPPGVSLKTIVRVELVPTHISITATPNPARPGAGVTLSVTSSADDGSIPSPITLTDNGNPLATLTPNAAGLATISISNFSTGAHTIVATYAGDSRHASSSATTTINIVLHDFTLALDPAALTIQTEHHSTMTLHLAPVGDFAESVSVACLNLPANATCTLSQTLANVGQPIDIQNIVDTDSFLRFKSSLETPDSHSPPNGSHPLTFLAWAPILLFGWRRRRPARNRRYSVPALMAFAALFAGLTALTGCSGKYPASTPPGSYVVTIQAVSASGITHTASLTLTVTR